MLNLRVIWFRGCFGNYVLGFLNFGFFYAFIASLLGTLCLSSPLDGTVSSSFPHPPPLQRRWQTHFPQLTLRLAQNFSSITYLRQGIEWLSRECELFTVCDSCESLKSVMQEIEDQIRNKPIPFYSKDHQEDMV